MTAPGPASAAEMGAGPDNPGTPDAGPGAASLPGAGSGDGRATIQRSQEGSRSLAGDETSIDMDAGLIELLTCPAEELAAAAERSWQRYERRARREIALYLAGLAEVAS